MRNPSRRALAVAALLIVGASACGDDDTATPTSSTATTAPSTTTGSSTSTTSAGASTTNPSAEDSALVFFVRDEKVGAVRRSVSAGSPARAALEALVSGPNTGENAAALGMAIPAGTRVLGVSIAGGVATVDLSKEFESGGGSLSMQERVAQVVYTATQFPTVQSVTFHVDGKAVTALGGEGLVLDKPQTRADWESMTPAILLESPLPGDRVTSPVHITGTANTFEATFMVTLTDSAGKKVYEHFVTATSGSGTRGTFDHTVTFTGAAPGVGTLQVWESSAKDGSAINVVKIAVTL